MGNPSNACVISGIDCRTLQKALRTLMCAISTEETRYYLCGIHVECDNTNGLVLTSTNGHILTSFTLAKRTKGEKEGAAILTRKAVKLAIKTLAKHKGACGLVIFNEYVELILDDCAVVLECTDASYPDWRRVLPHAADKSLSFACNPSHLRKELDAIIKGAKAWQGCNTITRFAATEKSWLTLSGAYHRPTWEEYTHTITRGKRCGEKVTRKRVLPHEETAPFEHKVCPGPIKGNIYVGFNARYVRQLLDGIKGPVVFEGADASGPWRIVAKDGGTRVIMPCRI